ncbi:MAG: O-antigen ligase family protein [Desulfohalobiaceae bacterium]
MAETWSLNRSSPWWDWIARACLCGLALGAFYGVGLANSMVACLLVLTLAHLGRETKTLLHQPITILALLFCGYVVLYGLVLYSTGAMTLSQAFEGSKNWIYVGFWPGIAVAYWLGRWPGGVKWLLGFLAAGHVLRVLTRIDYSQLHRYWEGAERATFGNSANNFATWSAIVAVVAIYFILRIFNKHRLFNIDYLVLIVYTVLLLFALSNLLFSQARGGWLAFISFIFLFVMLKLIETRKTKDLKKNLIYLVSIMLVIIILGSAGHNIINKRFMQVKDSVINLSKGEVASLEANTVRLRYKMAKQGILDWLEQPFWGRGPGKAKHLLLNSNESEISERGFVHYHNSYLMILSELGIIGTILFFSGVWICWKSMIITRRQDWLSKNESMFIWGTVLITVIAALFSHPLFSYRWPYLMALLIGIAISGKFRDSISCQAQDKTQ